MMIIHITMTKATKMAPKQTGAPKRKLEVHLVSFQPQMGLTTLDPTKLAQDPSHSRASVSSRGLLANNDRI